MTAFVSSHLLNHWRSNPPGCEKYWCRWCGVRSYAQPGSGIYEREVCPTCDRVAREDTRHCNAHGQYNVLVKTDGEIIGECRKCYEVALHAQRRLAGQCELCGTDLGIFARWSGRVQCKAGMCKHPLI